MPFSDSEILTTSFLKYELNKLCEFSIDQKWNLIYRASDDGFSARDFHAKCDGYPNTLTIFKVKDAPNVFGGFASVAWDSSNQHKRDPYSFIFSIKNNVDYPVKLNPFPINSLYAISCFEFDGPSFGRGDISYSGFGNRICFSSLGSTFRNPNLNLKNEHARNFLGGSINFFIAEIEVFSKN